MTNDSLSYRARMAVLLAAFAGLVFDGIELGLMPVASRSVSQSLLGSEFSDALAGDWFSRFTASLMLGAAVGGIVLGILGDRIGRTRAMGISILLYSVFAGLGALVISQEQMLLLRFLVGLGVGGMWPNGVVLVSECWPNASRPLVAGIMGAGINVGILMLSQLARMWPVTPDSWRWIFYLSALPTVLGLLVLFALPESPKWLAVRRRLLSEKSVSENSASGNDRDAAIAPGQKSADNRPIRDLFRPPLLRLTLLGIVLASIPLVGAWAASKWMIPWADKVASGTHPGYKAIVQGWWALGAAL